MKNNPATISVDAWTSTGILLEQYAYTPGAVEPLPKHAHEEYQLGLSFDCHATYFYRGAYHPVQIGSLSIIHSGEVHSPSSHTHLPHPAHFVIMHIHPQWMKTAVTDMGKPRSSLPFFADPCITNPRLNRLFLALQTAISQAGSALERETTLWEFLAELIEHHARNRPIMRTLPSHPPAVQRACDYLQAHYNNDVSLEQLAAIAGLSRFHFCRIFRQAIGLSPNVYQNQLRIQQAKQLLLLGYPIAQVSE
ncbi:hypothetical protein C7B61_10900, partial [filamentous cyanobacterium CCP1]